MKKKSVRGFVFGVAAALLFSAFALWQLGVLTFLPSPGRLAESFQATGESITLLDFRLSAWDEDPDAVPSPTVYGDPGEVVVILDGSPEEATGLPEAAAASLAAAESFAEMTPEADPVTALPDAPGMVVIMATGTQSEPTAEMAAADVTETLLTMTPTIDTAFRCGDMRHQFEAGAAGMSNGSSIKVRSEPTTGEQLTILRAGMMFQVLDAEPVCDGTYMWIKIHVASENVTGWTVEADDRYYWVVPAK